MTDQSTPFMSVLAQITQSFHRFTVHFTVARSRGFKVTLENNLIGRTSRPYKKFDTEFAGKSSNFKTQKVPRVGAFKV